MKYRKKPVVIDATQWYKNGDHPDDDCYSLDIPDAEDVLSEGKVVRYYGYRREPHGDRSSGLDGQIKCGHCDNIMHYHGWIETLEGRDDFIATVASEGHIVCPGDWIITGIRGEYYPCKPDIFELTYEKEFPVPTGFFNDPATDIDFRIESEQDDLREDHQGLDEYDEEASRRKAGFDLFKLCGPPRRRPPPRESKK